MYEKVVKPKENESRAVDNSVGQKKSKTQQGFGFTDNRPESVVQRKLQSIMNSNSAHQVMNTSMVKNETSTDSGTGSNLARKTAYQVVQRSSKVTGKFLDPTPGDNAVIEATGRPLKSPQFQVKARFDLVSPNENYGYGEYRQYVWGAFKRNGEVQEHLLKGGQMSETEPMEDIIGRKRYGYRTGVLRAPYGFFNDVDCTDSNRSGGQYFRSFDEPQAANDDDEMDLHFRGALLDTDDGEEIAETRWRVYGVI